MQVSVEQIAVLARKAGAAIMDVYQTDFSAYEKSDSSPLTEADLAAHRIIVAGLAEISDYPILSEESDPESVDWARRSEWDTYWLVDPLDGTKEFIKKNDEFTVNIALIDNGKPILGVVYCPPLNRIYAGVAGQGAYRQDGENFPVAIQVSSAPENDEMWKVVGSRSHGAEALEQFSAGLGCVELVSMGSSLKLCLVAEGAAHLYPRLAPTCEWDTGAAQAVVEAAGGKVLNPGLEELTYGTKEELLNPYFVVCGKVDELWAQSFKLAAKNSQHK